MTDPDPRARLHHAIRREFSAAITGLYRRYPQWLEAPHSEATIKVMLELLEKTLAMIDTFEISDPKGDA